ncbi:MAG: DNA methyltransferase, partial [Ignavibacteriales bacterium]
MDILSVLDNIISKESLESIKTNVSKFYYDIENQFEKTVSYNLNGNSQSIKKELLIKELKQILDTQTIERTKYYLNRLLKSLSVQKEGKINDLNLNRWKEYEDIITDSLWIFDKRDTSGMHKA